MKVVAKKSVLSGNIAVPGSKSHTIRALILASMADGVSHISNPLSGDDCFSTVKAIEKIGGKVTFGDNNVWTVFGAGDNIHIPSDFIDVGNSGSLMYFLAPVLATLSGKCLFTGDKSICKRPVNHLVDALNTLGATASCKKGNTPPFTFCGPIDVKKTLVTEGALSQYISGFMMAATRLDGTLNIKLTAPQETPYLKMTKLWLDDVCGKTCADGTERVFISDDFKSVKVRGSVSIKGFDREVPSDWEGVAFPLIAALISGSSITIDNVDGSGSQGDEKIVDVLKSVGADIEWNKEKCTLSVSAKSELSTKNLPHGELCIDISNFPDAVCALSAIACFIDGKTVITNVEICRKKETDRIKAMKTELCKLGGSVEEGENCLIIYGKNRGFGLHGGNCESYKDHRIAMSLACLGLGLSEGESLTVCDAECCNVSFPHFFEVMNKIGAGFVCK